MLLSCGSFKILHNYGSRYLHRQQMKVPLFKTLFNLSTKQCSTAAIYKANFKINNVSLTNYISKLEQEYQEIYKEKNYASNSRWLELQPIHEILDQRKSVIENLSSLKELVDSKDEDLVKLAKEEKAQFEEKLKEINDDLLEALLPVEKEDLCDSIVLEIQAGVGGQEAMLFAKEIYDMYCGFIIYRGWDYEIAEYLATDIGGLRHASILVNGPSVFKYFNMEAGVHRVQRTPATEKAGRIHTSTVSVNALPQPSDIEINVDQKDLKIETKRSMGAGGQHVNTTDSAVRIVHLPTGISVECQIDRSQIKNRKYALARLRALLYQKELDSQMAQTQATRKSQVRTKNRNEKIRTYNYNQDRITDHRLTGVHYHNLKVFMDGGADLETLIGQLLMQEKVNRLLELVENTCK